MGKYRDFLSKVKATADYWMTVARSEFTADLHQLIRESRMSQTALAQSMGTSQPYIAKALQGNENFTLRTMAKFAVALGAALHVRLIRRDEILERKVPRAADSGELTSVYLANWQYADRLPADRVPVSLSTGAASSSTSVQLH